MRNFRVLAAGASALALLVSACAPSGGASPTTAAAPPTTAPAKPTAAPAVSPAASASPSAAAAASPKPAVSPAPSPAAAASPVAAAGGAKPTVKVGSFGFDESEVLQELYAGVLEANGYTIERHPRLGSREIVEPALESGQIDLVPEYLATIEAFLAGKAGTPSKATSDPAVTQTALQALLTPKNITVLDFAANAIDTNGFVVTKATADKNKLAKMSDLQPVAGTMVLGGPPECPQRPFCLVGLMGTYKLQFKDFKPLDAGGPLTVTALDSGDIDIGLLFTTDPNILLKNYVLLADDMHLQLADNIAPVVSNKILTAGADSKTLLNSVTAKLTTADLTDLDKQVGIDHKDAKTVAVAYLKSKSLIK
ncbi:MAG TPA: ABC transporter substrate-binding protein [Chloroflexota bacterium]|nr:ABC transporter substrate-binding protein [Chloroflexota bacterium]